MMFLSLLQALNEPAFEFEPVVKDTTLLKSRANDNYGREQYLLGGDGRALLIEFPDLVYRQPAGKKVGSATLVFNLARADSVGQVSISRMLRPWGEGRGRVTPMSAGLADEVVAWGNSNWKVAQKGLPNEGWNGDGASGPQDARPVDGLEASQNGDILRLTGLGETVQGWLNAPERNFGLRIVTSRDAAMHSGEWPKQRPRLEIEWVDSALGNGPDLAVVAVEPSSVVSEGKPATWTATIANVGSADAELVSAVWKTPDGREVPAEVAGGLAAGASRKVSLELNQPAVYGDPRRSVLQFSATTSGDVDGSNNDLKVWTLGAPVYVELEDSSVKNLLNAQKHVGFLNDVVAPFSRFGFAPEGLIERFRLVTNADLADATVIPTEHEAPAAWPWKGVDYGMLKSMVQALIPIEQDSLVSPISGEPVSGGATLGWLADTRDEGLRIPALTMPDPMWVEPRPNEPMMPENGFLSRVEAGYLQSNVLKRGDDRGWKNLNLAESALIRVHDTLGRPLNDGEVALYLPGREEPISKGRVARGGFTGLTVPKGSVTAESPYLILGLTRGGTEDRTTVSVWDLYDWRIRGNKSAANLEVYLMTTDVSINAEANLAEGKIITDSRGRFPAELTVLIDGKYDAGLVVEPGNWVEIDIGRDRTFGAVELTYDGAPFDGLELYTFKTGQGPTDATPFYRDKRADRTAKIFGTNSPNGLTVVFKSSAVQSRYVRLINTGTKAATLKEVRVLPAQ